MAAAEEEDGGPEGPNCERGGAGVTLECNIRLETARKLWSVCVATCTVGPVFISGWRRGQSGRSAQCVKLGSAEKRLSLFMGEGVRSPRTPD